MARGCQEQALEWLDWNWDCIEDIWLFVDMAGIHRMWLIAAFLDVYLQSSRRWMPLNDRVDDWDWAFMLQKLSRKVRRQMARRILLHADHFASLRRALLPHRALLCAGFRSKMWLRGLDRVSSPASA